MATEKRLIDVNELIEALPIVTEDKQVTLYGAVADFMVMISAMPTVDAVILPYEPRPMLKDTEIRIIRMYIALSAVQTLVAIMVTNLYPL